ncbi:hypothetical protein GCM10020255_013050 [Rhodococcus baikonurensis]
MGSSAGPCRAYRGQAPAAIQGSIRAIWESKDATRSQALATGMSYTSLGNPIGKAQVVRSEVPTRKYEVR